MLNDFGESKVTVKKDELLSKVKANLDLRVVHEEQHAVTRGRLLPFRCGIPRRGEGDARHVLEKAAVKRLRARSRD